VVDGNDVVAVAQAVAQAAALARAGEGPTVLEAKTYRHFGHSRTDPATYRPEEEVRQWLSRDPLDIARARLEALGVPGTSVAAADARAARQVEQAVAAAKAASAPDPATAFTDVWADGGSAWRT
jgi:pyruvate dehydrogenase E1 component alpha subunit